MRIRRRAALAWVLAVVACNLGSPLASGTPSSQASTPFPPATLPAATSIPAAMAFHPAAFKQGVDSAVPAFMSANNVLGCSAAVVYPDAASRKLLSQTFNYGVASGASGQPASASTLYEIGSISKLFTADVLALFVTQGRMALDDPLQKYLPATVHVPTFDQKTITLRDLSTHTSGLPRTPGVPSVRKVYGLLEMGYVTNDELFAFINGYQLTVAPGTRWLYSNVANALLGVAEEQAGGGSYESILVQTIALPLGLPDTRVTLSAAEQANLAQGYEPNGQPAPAFAVTGPGLAAGGLRATIRDLATYLIDNLDPGATPLAAPLQLTRQRQSFGPKPNVIMGLGWIIVNPGTPAEQFTKQGETAGFNSYIAFSPVTQTGFAVVCNGHSVTSKLVPEINKLVGASEIAAEDTPEL